MNARILAFSTLLCLSTGHAAEESKPTEKPLIVVVADGFPAGNTTPEGAACDLARAFIGTNSKLFLETCISPFGGGKGREAYEKFLKSTATEMEEQSLKKTPASFGPKKLTKVFAARHLSRNGPASAGFAMHDFQDIMFVDVEAELVSGKRFLNRTLVIRKKDGKWYVHPAPETESLLSMGLNDEKSSTTDFSEAYKIEQPPVPQPGGVQPPPNAGSK